MPNFLLQAVGCVVLATAGGTPGLLVLGSVLFGLGIGNLLSLPPLIAQAEWPAAEVAAVIALVTAVNQAMYAFGPGAFGAALDVWGAWAPPAAACLLQLAAAGVLARRGHRGVLQVANQP